MVKKKGKSKRTTLKQKYKIDKKVKAHKRQQRKDAKKHPNRKKKDPGIPNSIPFKAEVLAEIEVAKARAAEVKLQQKEKRKLELMKRRGIETSEATLDSLVSKAEQKLVTYNIKSAAENDEHNENDMKQRPHGEQSRRAYMRELRKVVDHSDVVLQVLDARDPLGSRASTVEEAIQSRSGKRLILVLNKVDLVPKEVVSKWLAVLRLDHPTIAFKASTQGGGKLHQGSGDAMKTDDGTLGRSGSIGAEALMNILKNYCRSLDIKTAITVGVIGYPNVGKSSLINSLKRSKAVGVSSTPGFTKSMQPVQLDKMIKLLDSPGVVFDDSDSSSVLLRNCVDIENLPDPLPAIEAILERCKPEQLMQVYAIPKFDKSDVSSFLAVIARKLGKLQKGGTPDRIAAARHVLRGWNSGKVPYYSLPPENIPRKEKSGNVEDAKLVYSFGPEFDPLALETLDNEIMAMSSLTLDGNSDHITFSSNGISSGNWITENIDEMNDEVEAGGDSSSDEDLSNMPSADLKINDEDAKSEQDTKAPSSSNMTTSKVKLSGSSQLSALLAEERALNPQLNRDNKKQAKANKKLSRRQQKKETAAIRADAYNFNKNYQVNGDANGQLSEDDDL